MGNVCSVQSLAAGCFGDAIDTWRDSVELHFEGKNYELEAEYRRSVDHATLSMYFAHSRDRLFKCGIS